MHPPSTTTEEGHAVLPEEEEDWEEWDGRSPFWVHCVAGSFAGVVEHAAVYPLDTVRTHIQVCASCVHRHQNQASALLKNHIVKSATSSPASVIASGGLRGLTTLHAHQLPTGMWQTVRFLMNEPVAMAATATNTSVNWGPGVGGLWRLWRGVQTILIGCVPAHALYFSSYEMVKAATLDSKDGHVTTWGSSLAGAAAVFSHDVVMTPLDTIKQRMQLGHYDTASQAMKEIIRAEGHAALYRSFSITLVSNIPYGMIMVSTHEACKEWLLSSQVGGNRRPTWQTVLLASSVAGFTAAALTTPLDRIKTALQTQRLAPACFVNPAELCQKAASLSSTTETVPFHDTWQSAARHILQTEGWRGFFRGMTPRVLSQVPAVAISWTTYEMTKQALLHHYHLDE